MTTPDGDDQPDYRSEPPSKELARSAAKRGLAEARAALERGRPMTEEELAAASPSMKAALRVVGSPPPVPVDEETM